MFELNNLDKMNKKELIELIHQMNDELSKKKQQKSNKKYDVLEILKNDGPISILDISNILEISTKNVSSLLSYLRKQDNIVIHTDDKGRKYIVE